MIGFRYLITQFVCQDAFGVLGGFVIDVLGVCGSMHFEVETRGGEVVE